MQSAFQLIYTQLAWFGVLRRFLKTYTALLVWQKTRIHQKQALDQEPITHSWQIVRRTEKVKKNRKERTWPERMTTCMSPSDQTNTSSNSFHYNNQHSPYRNSTSILIWQTSLRCSKGKQGWPKWELFTNVANYLAQNPLALNRSSSDSDDHMNAGELNIKKVSQPQTLAIDGSC